MEDFKKSLEEAKVRTEKLAEIRREMQKTLIEESAPKEGDKDGYIVDWISENREKFASIFERLLAEEPNLSEKWENNRNHYIKKIEVMMAE